MFGGLNLTLWMGVCMCGCAEKQSLPFALIHLFCFGPLFRLKVEKWRDGDDLPVCATRGALPAEPRDSPSLKDAVALTLSPSMSLDRTKAIWGAAESFSNKITLSICTLHGSDCRALRSPIPRLLLDLLLLLLHPSNPGLHD